MPGRDLELQAAVALRDVRRRGVGERRRDRRRCRSRHRRRPPVVSLPRWVASDVPVGAQLGVEHRIDSAARAGWWPRTSSRPAPANRRGTSSSRSTSRAVSSVSGAYVGATSAPTSPQPSPSSVTTRTSRASLSWSCRARFGTARRAAGGSGSARRRARGWARRGSVRASGPGHSARARDRSARVGEATFSACAPVAFFAGAFLAGAFLAPAAFLAGAFFAAFLAGGFGSLAGEHGVLEVLERRDARDALRLDLHRLAGRWVAREACRDGRCAGTSRSRRSQRLRRSATLRGDDVDERRHVARRLPCGSCSLSSANLLSSWLRFTSVLHRGAGDCAGCIVTRSSARCRDSGENFQGFLRGRARNARLYGAAGAV